MKTHLYYRIQCGISMKQQNSIFTYGDLNSYVKLYFDSSLRHENFLFELFTNNYKHHLEEFDLDFEQIYHILNMKGAK